MGFTATLFCSVWMQPPLVLVGDHTILLGEVRETVLGEHLPALYFRRRLHPLSHV